MRQIFVITTFLVIILTACKKDDPISTSLAVDFTQTVDGVLLEPGNIQYANAAGQNYSVIKLWYIISDITLHADDGTDNLIKEVHFIDIDNPSTLSFTVNNLNNNNYTSISYTMGLDTTKNISNLYVDEDFHSDMFWPEEMDNGMLMGGGYHYMKLEGKFDADTTFYNTHTGGTMGMDYSFNHNDEISLITDETISEANISINMEINNWYQNPNSITLSTDGIMGNMMMQMKIKQNGVDDVFSTLIN